MTVDVTISQKQYRKLLNVFFSSAYRSIGADQGSVYAKL